MKTNHGKDPMDKDLSKVKRELRKLLHAKFLAVGSCFPLVNPVIYCMKAVMMLMISGCSAAVPRNALI